MSKTCPAALNIQGEHFDCDWPTDANGRHDGWAHASRAAQAIWIDDRHSIPAATKETS